MLKKGIFVFVLILGMVPVLVHAAGTSSAKIGDRYYDTLEEAIANASATDIITLTSNVTLDDTLVIDKVVNLDLNGHVITAPTKVFQVQGGTFNVSGKGTIKEVEPNYGAVMIKGSSNSSDSEYSVVNVGPDVTLEGWSGIFITHDSSKAYGVVVNLDGKINAVNDVNGGSGIGVYVNGNIAHQNNSPVINILDNAEIVSNGNGLYIAGYSVFNIGKAYISGIQSGIGIKSGILNIDGATVVCTGQDSIPTEGYNNGIYASGSAIQIESNNGYAGNIELNISNGSFMSKHSNVVYEYIGRGDSSLVHSINISGGTFVSEDLKDVFLFSNSFEGMHHGFVTGGIFSSNPSLYLKSGYTSVLDNDMYNVVKSTMKSVFFDNYSTGSNSFGKVLIVLIGVIAIVFLVYFNRMKIINLFKK